MNSEKPTAEPVEPVTAIRPEDERLSPGATLGYGIQHIAAMFGGVIAVPLIISTAAHLSPTDTAVLVSGCLFISGLATLLQTLGVPGFGSQLPLVQGVSFATVATMTAIIGSDGGKEELRTVFGAVILACAVGLLIVPLFARIVRFFPAVVTGSVITVIGLSLMPVAAGWITGQEKIRNSAGELVDNAKYLSVGNIGLAMATLLLILICSKIQRLTRVAILIGLVGGTVIAACFGQVTTKAFDGASVFGFPKPFAFGWPIFAVGACVSMFIAVLVIMVETTADVLAVGEVVGTEVDGKRVSAGLRADLGASVVAPVFNSFPATAFAQNVGLVALTGIKSRFAVAAGGVVLLVLGLSPMAAAVVGLIPTPVLGGAGIALFGTVAASGIRTLGKVDYDGTSNLIVVGVSVGLGLVPVVSPHFWERLPEWAATILHSGISCAAIAAVILNIAFNLIRPTKPSGSTLAEAPALQITDVEMRILAEGGAFEAGQPVKVRTATPPEPSHHDH
ncbi:MAG: nucleobase:cation symporter-2 family protein [Gordonia sp. (in: high G+C Gram-positive bacteria)]